MVDELLAARGTTVSHETVRQWGRCQVGEVGSEMAACAA